MTTPQEVASMLLAARAPTARPNPSATDLPRAQWPKCSDPYCNERLDPIWWQDGIHPLCQAPKGTGPTVEQIMLDTSISAEPLPAPGAPSTEPPPSTVAEIGPLLREFDASSARSKQIEVGPSELGTPCRRQLAYKLAGTPKRQDPRVPWAPLCGTAVHTLMENVLRWHNAQLGWDRWIVEQELWPDDTVHGHGDAYDTKHEMAVDWKYTGKSTLADARRGRIRAEYKVQLHLYGLGQERAGRTPRFVRDVFLARSHDYWESTEYTEPYQPDIAFTALDRMYQTIELIDALKVAENPALWAAIEAAPGRDTCVWCPFQRPGGPADGTGCPGDIDSAAKQQQRFGQGLIT